jgi:hypothetical protein
MRLIHLIFLPAIGLALAAAPSALAKQPPKSPTPPAVITNWGGDSVSLIDVEEGKELAKISVCLKRYDIQGEKTGRIAYASRRG